MLNRITNQVNVILGLPILFLNKQLTKIHVCTSWTIPINIFISFPLGRPCTLRTYCNVHHKKCQKSLIKLTISRIIVYTYGILTNAPYSLHINFFRSYLFLPPKNIKFYVGFFSTKHKIQVIRKCEYLNMCVLVACHSLFRLVI